MNKISRRSFMKISALTAAAVAVAGATTGCSVPVLKPGYTVTATKFQRCGDLNIAFVSASKDGAVGFAVQNMTDKEVKVSKDAFTIWCKADNADLKVLGLTTATTNVTKLDDTVTIPANSTGTTLVFGFEKKDKTDYPLTVKFHQGKTSIEFNVTDAAEATATTPYTDFVF